MSYFPLDRDILTSSVWAQGTPEQIKVWLYLLLAANPRNGIVEDADPGIALRCGLSLESTTAALDWLAAPDLYSRTKHHDGRRIERLSKGGFRVLNYVAHRDKDYSTPRVRRFRERTKKFSSHSETRNGVSTVTETVGNDGHGHGHGHEHNDNDNGKAPPAPAGPRRRPRTETAASSHPDASRFVAAFNATFGRRVTLTPKLARDFATRAAEGYAPDVLVALPLLVDAQGMPDDLRKGLRPAWLLRNGERAYTTRNGERHPSKAWVEDALQRADQTRLWPRHVTIAREAGCLDELRRLGCRISEEPEP